MEQRKSIFGFTGVALGAVALMLALVHFWAGPFSPQPSLEEVVAEKAVAIRDATIAKLKGEDIAQKTQSAPRYDMDRVASLTTAILGGLAVVLGIIGVALNEPIRVAGGAAILGTGAIAFQFAVLALGVLALVLLVGAVLGELGFG